MMRPWLVLPALLLPLAGHAASVTQPTIFTAISPDGFVPAPVPNQDITPPTRGYAAGPTFSADLRQPKIPLRSGDGFTPGSNFSDDVERRTSRTGGIGPGVAPSLSIKFPFD